jgi:VanZ family protein
LKKSNPRRLRLLLVILTVAWMAVIFAFSAQPASDSSRTSGNTVRAVAEVVDPGFKQKPVSAQEQIVSEYQHLARKSAHSILYFVLGGLVAATLGNYEMNPWIRIAAAEGIAALYAVSDEFHQRFIGGRSAQVSDVLLDSAAALLGVLIVAAFLALRRRRRRRREDAGHG